MIHAFLNNGELVMLEEGWHGCKKFEEDAQLRKKEDPRVPWPRSHKSMIWRSKESLGQHPMSLRTWGTKETLGQWATGHQEDYGPISCGAPRKPWPMMPWKLDYGSPRDPRTNESFHLDYGSPRNNCNPSFKLPGYYLKNIPKSHSLSTKPLRGKVSYVPGAQVQSNE